MNGSMTRGRCVSALPQNRWDPLLVLRAAV